LTSDDIEKKMKDYVPVGEHGYKHFAVLVLVVDGEEPELLYEVRSKDLNRQPGEVCFPGGMIEDGETPVQCALRETFEEIGIAEEEIRIVCELDQINSTAGSALHSFLGIVSREAFEKMEPCALEVDEVFTVPVDELLHMEPEVYQNKLVQEIDDAFPYDSVTGGKLYPWRSGTAPVPVFYAGDRVIWGLTGRITKQLMEVLKCSE